MVVCKIQGRKNNVKLKFLQHSTFTSSVCSVCLNAFYFIAVSMLCLIFPPFMTVSISSPGLSLLTPFLYSLQPTMCSGVWFASQLLPPQVSIIFFLVNSSVSVSITLFSFQDSSQPSLLTVFFLLDYFLGSIYLRVGLSKIQCSQSLIQ